MAWSGASKRSTRSSSRLEPSFLGEAQTPGPYGCLEHTVDPGQSKACMAPAHLHLEGTEGRKKAEMTGQEEGRVSRKDLLMAPDAAILSAP